jgi:hypothetical protein
MMEVEITVANAAPRTPRAGNPSKPNMRRGGDDLAFEQGIAARPDRSQRCPQRHVQGRYPVPGAHVIRNQRQQFRGRTQQAEYRRYGGQADKAQYQRNPAGQYHGVGRQAPGQDIIFSSNGARHAGCGRGLEPDSNGIDQPDDREGKTDGGQRRITQAGDEKQVDRLE